MRNSSTYQKFTQALLREGDKFVRWASQLWVSESGLHTLVFAIVVFIMALLYFVQRAHYPFYYDSLYYWDLTGDFEGGKFAFTNYSNELRGYLFPFLLFILKKQAGLFGFDAKLLFHLYSTLFFTIFSVYIVPWFFSTVSNRKPPLWGRFLFTLLLFFFWRGHFLYPLSDFPAFASLLVGVTLILSTLKNRIMPLWRTLLIGLFIGAAINIRPVYLFSLIFIVLLALFQLYRVGVARGIPWTGFLLLGFGLILLPQFQINRTHHQVNSPWVLARVASDENLFVKQLFWGLSTQKIESNIGDSYPSIIVVYDDPFVLNLQKTNLLREKTLARYVRIMERFPSEIAVSYFRHTFNGLDIFFPTPYVTNIYASHNFFSLVNYLIWFLVIYKLLKLDVSRLEFIHVFGLLSLLSPVLLAIPTAVEVRFFLPAHIMAYGVVGFGLDYDGLLKSFLSNRQEILRFVAACALWIIVCFTLSTATIENLVQ